MHRNVGYSAETLNGFLRRLHIRGAVKIDTERGSTLKLHEKNPEAPPSPLYFNLRVPSNKGGPLNEMDVREIAEFFYYYLKSRGTKFDAICPVPNAGDPFAKELKKIFHERNGTELQILELSKEEDAGGRRIGKLKETPYTPVGMVVLVLDDLISRSDSKAEAVISLRRAGCLVRDCLVFLDREQGGAKALGELGVNLHSIVRLSNVLGFYKDSGIITTDQYAIIHAYLKTTL